MTSGEIIFPKNNPNLNQILFKGVSTFELIIPKIRNNIEINKAQYLICSLFNSGHKLTIKKTIKKTIPKLLLVVLFLIFIV